MNGPNRILITADIHCGIPGKTHDVLWALRTMSNYAQQENITHIIVLGDLFHDRVSINIEVLNAVYDFFEHTPKSQQWICLPGNHDTFLRNSWEINSIRPLGKLLKAIDSKTSFLYNKQRFWVLPFIHNEDKYMMELKQIKAKKDDILLTHIGVNGAILNSCFLMQYWNVVTFQQTVFKRIFTGHFHCHQDLNNVHYPGSPISFRFDDGMEPHGFLTYDIADDVVQFHGIYETAQLLNEPGNPPPRHITLTDADLNKAIEFKGDEIRISLEKEYSTNELRDIKHRLMEHGIKAVKWIYPKKQEGAKQKADNVVIDLKNPDNFFQTWIKHDQPTGFNIKLLSKLNRQIYNEAMDRLVTDGEE